MPTQCRRDLFVIAGGWGSVRAGAWPDHQRVRAGQSAMGGVRPDVVVVERPALIRRLRQRQGCSRPGRALAATPAPNRQSLLAVPPVQLLVVHGHALALEQNAEPSVAKAPGDVGGAAPTSTQRTHVLKQGPRVCVTSCGTP